MTPDQLANLRALATRAPAGPWKGDRYDGSVKYELLDANGDAVIRGCNGNHDPQYGIVGDGADDYLLAVSPDVVLGLLDALAAEKAARRHALDQQRAAFAKTLGEAETAAYLRAREDALTAINNAGDYAHRMEADRDRLAARVLELEAFVAAFSPTDLAPGERQSLHKLRAERDEFRSKSEESYIDGKRQGAIIGSQSALYEYGLRVKAEAERDDQRDKIAGVLRDLCPELVDESIAPMDLCVRDVLSVLVRERGDRREAVATLRAERDELAAEVSAYQGRPEGALPGWTWGEDDGPAWVRPLACGEMVAHVDGEWLIDWAEIVAEQRSSASPRQAMRAAEAAARSRGWL